MQFVFGNQTGNDWKPLQHRSLGTAEKRGEILLPKMTYPAVTHPFF